MMGCVKARRTGKQERVKYWWGTYPFLWRLPLAVASNGISTDCDSSASVIATGICNGKE